MDETKRTKERERTMSDVKPVINTAEGANATVPLPAPPSGPSEGAPAHQDGPVSNHDLIEAERAARAGEYGFSHEALWAEMDLLRRSVGEMRRRSADDAGAA